MYLKKNLLILCCVVEVTACGFRLKGLNSSLQNSQNNESISNKLLRKTIILSEEWKQKAKGHFGLELLAKKNECNPCEKVIILLNTEYQKDILSLNSAGRVREYRLKYNVNYESNEQNKPENKQQKKFSLYRDMTFNDATILAKQQEEELLKKDMEREILEILANQL